MMKKIVVFVLWICAFVGVFAREMKLMRRDVEVLASDSVETHKFGTSTSLFKPTYYFNR